MKKYMCRKALMCSSKVLLSFLLISCFTFASATVGFEPAQQNNSAELFLTELSNNGQGQKTRAILLDTSVTGEINGMVATITINQTFKNTSANWVDGVYTFPLPEDAAVDDLTLIIGERIIKSTVKEKAEAKKAFNKAKKEGKKAGLLEQQRPNLFTMSVANIAPNSNIVAQIRYVEKARFRDGEFSLRLPTTLTPRYIPGQPIEVNVEEEGELIVETGFGWAMDTDEVPDASHITPEQIRPAENENTNMFSIDLQLKAGMKLARLDSTSHELDIERKSKVQRIRFINQFEPMDRDFILRWQPQVGKTPNAAVFQQEFEGDYYSMLMFLPPKVNVNQVLPRDMIFIIDSSGSMAGASMHQAIASLKLALKYLTPNDRFNIIDFDSTTRPLFINSRSASNNNISNALHMISGLQADGGTEMKPALQIALNSPESEQYLKQIVFITDGSVGNEAALFKLIHNHLGNSRLFTVGIGAAPNTHFMSKAAQYGRGTFTYISSTHEVAEKMDALFKKINRPLLRDIQINWPGGSEGIEAYPKRIPDLYAGEPLTVIAKSKKPLGKIKVQGKLLDKNWNRSIKHPASNNAQNLDALWAKRKITTLLDSMVTDRQPEEVIKPQVVSLGVKHNLASKYTSFIAIEQKPSRPLNETSKKHNVPNLMPAGNTMAIPMPQTATSATLFLWLGMMGMLLALLIRPEREAA